MARMGIYRAQGLGVSQILGIPGMPEMRMVLFCNLSVGAYGLGFGVQGLGLRV